MSDLEKWPAPLRKIWDAAIDKEWDGLNGRNTFIHGIRKADFVKHGAPPNKVIGMRKASHNLSDAHVRHDSRVEIQQPRP
eukprot:COSAG02_NODE_64202_length_261_cov_0.635802_1_plen_79_part_01